VPLPEGLPVQGVVLADQLKSIDRHARQIEVVGRAPAAVVAQVRARFWALLGQ
jgi:mRNA interferase MazF